MHPSSLSSKAYGDLLSYGLTRCNFISQSAGLALYWWLAGCVHVFRLRCKNIVQVCYLLFELENNAQEELVMLRTFSCWRYFNSLISRKICFAMVLDLNGSWSFFTATDRHVIRSFAELTFKSGLLVLTQILWAFALDNARSSYQTSPDTPMPKGSNWLYLFSFLFQRYSFRRNRKELWALLRIFSPSGHLRSQLYW